MKTKKSMVYSAAPTPFNDDYTLDVQSLQRMLEKNIEDGIQGFFLCGNMGEWSQYDLDLKRQLVAKTVEIVNGRAEVLAGITANSLCSTLTNMRELSKFNPDSYAVMLPLPKTSSYNPVEYITAVLDASDRPVYYYHCPPVTGINFAPTDFEQLLQHPNLKGIKNSAGDIGVRKELLLLKRKYDFILLEGHEWGIDEALITGCDGVLCGMAALAGKLMVRIANMVDAGEWDKARELQFTLIDIFHGIYGINTSDVHNGHKYALKQLGIFSNGNCCNVPSTALSSMSQQRIDACLKQYRYLL